MPSRRRIQLSEANAIKHFEAVDRAETALNRQAVKIVADPRRLAAVQSGCPKFVTDIQNRAQSAGAPRQVADPAHDPSLLEAWLKSLPEDVLAEVETASKSETAARKKAKAPQGKGRST